MAFIIQGPLTLAGRIMLSLIFLMSAVGNKIPQFSATAEKMAGEGIPAPQIMLVGAILFLVAGSLSIMAGYKARIGASLLLVFLVLATYFFHDFWTKSGSEAQAEMIAFMKNVGLMGAMLMIIANGSGPMSWDGRK